ncbi:DUF2332 domain-containing protein [Streptacidiphilus fuscans]|uniref:DUF2332 domain-containing protein n=1 Tax=Streptacidiphilus fuscans TaxID=2789292 RepID=A0A931B090_9ACTN|nr:DUF2332 domain-containing protein [Streptacidiphilus fuscans]MBF9068770.1 DUF2332 domain-containing protein [Streptacidiphilus fuscans]
MTDKIANDPRASIRNAFADAREFTTSPLYRSLARVVAEDDALLDLAARGRAGQYPTFLFFGAVHHVLLSGVDHPLAAFFPSRVADPAPAEGQAAGAALRSFCAAYEWELTSLISSRLVQTNQVQRSLALRYGLATLLPETDGTPVHLIEVGASAGLNLGYDRYGYTVGAQRFGNPDSPVQLAAELLGDGPLPDLDTLPKVASVLGVDLNPIDIRDVEDRRWLEALIWPENHDQRRLFSAASELIAADAPPIRAGDAAVVLPELAASLPAGEPRVVYHSGTRMHVPAHHLDAFDAGIESLGADGPLWWLSLEDAPDPALPRSSDRFGAALNLRGPDGERRTLAVVDGHLRWVEPMPW